MQLWLDYVKYLYSYIQSVPKSILTLQQTEIRLLEKRKLVKGLRNKFIGKPLPLSPPELQIISDCFNIIKEAQLEQGQVEINQAFEQDAKQTAIYQVPLPPLYLSRTSGSSCA